MSTRTAEAAVAVAGTAPPLSILMCWLSPAFPVGAFAYSHGLEWAVETNDVRDAASLEGWIATLLRDGFGRNEATLLFRAHDAALRGDGERLREVNDTALALSPSRELRLETVQGGGSFRDVVLAAWPVPAFADLTASLGPLAYPVALGAAAAAAGIDRREAATAHLTALVGNLVSAGIRLAPVGQTAGQAIVARLVRTVPAIVEAADETDLADLASSTFRADLGSLRHETQYTRLFRS